MNERVNITDIDSFYCYDYKKLEVIIMYLYPETGV